MNQQINLYQPVFRKQKKVFTAVAMLQVTLIAMALFILTGGYSYLQMTKLQQQEKKITAYLSRSQIQYKQLTAESGQGTRDKLLTAEINRLTREIEQKSSVALLLKKGPFANTRGFSGHFEALAREHVNGAWLTTIEISDGGTSLVLKGTTFSADLVPEYLQRLLREQVFAETSFNVLGMERSTTKPKEIHFQVQTGKQGKADGNS